MVDYTIEEMAEWKENAGQPAILEAVTAERETAGQAEGQHDSSGRGGRG